MRPRVACVSRNSNLGSCIRMDPLCAPVALLREELRHVPWKYRTVIKLTTRLLHKARTVLAM